MSYRLKAVRKEIRHYHTQLTKYKSEMTDRQIWYLLSEYKSAQEEHSNTTGGRYIEYELPKPYTVGSITLV